MVVKVGVIGCGMSAQVFHIPLITASASLELTAISSSKREVVEGLCPGVHVYDTPEALITESEVTLVVITAPNPVHFSLAKLAMENGKHVVVEKPMVNTTSEAKELFQLSIKTGLVLSTYHNRRWDGDFLTVKRLIEEGKVGEVKMFESHYDRFRPNVRDRWRERPGKGGGMWYDLGSHLLDQALTLFGLPISVTGRCIPLRANSSAVDYFHVSLHYESVEVILNSSPYSLGPQLRFQLQGSKGSYIKYGLDPQEDQLKAGMKPTNKEYGIEGTKNTGMLYLDDPDCTKVPTLKGDYPAFYANVANAIENGMKLAVPVNEVMWVVRLLELVQESSDKGITIHLDTLTGENMPDFKNI
eukprot:CFRG4699T1